MLSQLNTLTLLILLDFVSFTMYVEVLNDLPLPLLISKPQLFRSLSPSIAVLAFEFAQILLVDSLTLQTLSLFLLSSSVSLVPIVAILSSFYA